MYVNRKDILKKAYEDCLNELYKYAQPRFVYQEFLDIINHKKKDSKEDPLYQKAYLSKENFDYIINMFCDAYNIKEKWNSNINLIIENLKNGGIVDKYVNEEGKPPYRSYEEVLPLKDTCQNYKYVIDLIEKYKNFYKFDSEEASFRCQIYIGSSPSSSKEKVIEYWKKRGKDINIKDFNIEDIYFPEEND